MSPLCVPVEDEALKRNIARTMARLRPNYEQQLSDYRNAMNGQFGQRHARDPPYRPNRRMPRIDH